MVSQQDDQFALRHRRATQRMNRIDLRDGCPLTLTVTCAPSATDVAPRRCSVAGIERPRSSYAQQSINPNASSAGDVYIDPHPAAGLRSSPRINARAVSICSMVASSTLPIRRSNRDETTPRTARQIARLGRSIPAIGATSTRSADEASELDKGTTTISSPGEPVTSASSEATTAGRVLPGSPARPAPSATSQTSRRRGESGEAIAKGGLPLLDFGLRGRVLCIDATGFTFRAPNGFALTRVGDLGKQC